MVKRYTKEDALLMNKEYTDMTNTCKSISTKYNIKHETMLKLFKKYSLFIRSPGFRPGNCRGKTGEYDTNLMYAHHYKNQYKRRAIRKNLEFTLTVDQFISIVTSDCYYCGKSYLTDFRSVNKRKIPMNSVDRFDSNKGYTLDNCVPCCKVCNTSKMDTPYLEWISHMKAVLSKLEAL